MSRIVTRLFCLAATAALLGACTRTPDPVAIPAVSVAEIEAVAAKRIVFAHQSVGSSVLDGAQAIASKGGVALNVAESRQIPESANGIFHFLVGENGDPEGKLRDYMDTLGSAAWSSVDLAMIKLCYIDFSHHTDAEALAFSYVNTIEMLQLRHPHTHFVAVTAPLTTVQSGPKAWVKRLLGKVPHGVPENAKRHQFNEVVRSKFTGPNLFDLAKLEATGAPPTRLDGSVIEVLNPQLSSDGGHLNSQGVALLGAAFLKFIAAAPPRQDAATN